MKFIVLGDDAINIQSIVSLSISNTSVSITMIDGSSFRVSGKNAAKVWNAITAKPVGNFEVLCERIR